MQPPDNFTYLIFVDHVLHTPEKPFCYDAACDCHEDEVADLPSLAACPRRSDDT